MSKLDPNVNDSITKAPMDETDQKIKDTFNTIAPGLKEKYYQKLYPIQAKLNQAIYDARSGNLSTEDNKKAIVDYKRDVADLKSAFIAEGGTGPQFGSISIILMLQDDTDFGDLGVTEPVLP